MFEGLYSDYIWVHIPFLGVLLSRTAFLSCGENLNKEKDGDGDHVVFSIQLFSPLGVILIQLDLMVPWISAYPSFNAGLPFV